MPCYIAFIGVAFTVYMLQWMRQRKRKLTCVGALQAYMWWLIHYSVITSWMHTLLYKFYKVLFLLDKPIFILRLCAVLLVNDVRLSSPLPCLQKLKADWGSRCLRYIWFFWINTIVLYDICQTYGPSWQSFLFCFTCVTGWWPEARPRSAPPRWWRTSRCSSHLSCFRA